MEVQSFNSESDFAFKKAGIISQLEKQILPLQGLKTLSTDNNINLGFRAIEKAFPNAVFPIGCMHEFISSSIEDVSAASGFISGVLGKLMQSGGVCVWISTYRMVFPQALKIYGIEPEQIIFIDLKRERDVLYAMEDALQCNRLTAVMGEIKNISFKESRRFQLAAEQSRVTGFIIRSQPQVLNTIACVSRWRITSLPSKLIEGMPGVGFPRWNVELLKVRNGKPGSWKIEWSTNSFTEIKEDVTAIHKIKMRNVG